MGQGGGLGGCPAPADVNCDGFLSGHDAIIILRYLADLTTTIPGCPPVGATSV